MFVLRVQSTPGARDWAIHDQYVETFDHDADHGRGFGSFTLDVRRAMQFATAGEALEFWKRTSRMYPIRADGKPNRPLTATSMMEIVNLGDMET